MMIKANMEQYTRKEVIMWFIAGICYGLGIAGIISIFLK
jgi:hypothetical protein